MENINELDEMRSQMSVLNRKIEREAILNDKLMRRSMRSDVSFLKRKHLLIVILCIIMIPNFFFIFHEMGLSMALFIATVVLFLTIAAYTIYVNSHLCASDMMNGNLLDVRCKVAKAMKLEHDWLRIGMPMAIVWVVWYAYELLLSHEEERMFFFFGICFGLVVGLCIGFRIRRKILGTYRDILAQMDEIKNGI